jgi:type III secretion system YseE family protein
MSLYDLDKQLENDPDGVNKRALICRVRTMRKKLDQAMQQPTLPEQHQENLLLRDACTAAIRVIETVWRRHNNGMDTA